MAVSRGEGDFAFTRPLPIQNQSDALVPMGECLYEHRKLRLIANVVILICIIHVELPLNKFRDLVPGDLFEINGLDIIPNLLWRNHSSYFRISSYRRCIHLPA